MPPLPNATNVLLILLDDLKPILGAYGPSDLPHVTPNLDAFVRSKAVSFRNAHAQFSDCGPSRASFLTSLRPDTTLVYTLAPNLLYQRMQAIQRATGLSVLTLPGLLKGLGYRSYGIGKVWHEAELTLMTSTKLWDAAVYTWLYDDFYRAEPQFTDPYKGAWLQDVRNVTDEFFTDGQYAAFAIQLLDTLAADAHNQPFFLAVGFHSPHLPFEAPDAYYQMQAPVSEYPPVYNVEPPLGLSASAFYMARGIGCTEVNLYQGAPKSLDSWGAPSNVLQEANRGYHSAVTYGDAQAGKVLDALYSNPALNASTLVIVMSDHGWHLGDHSIYCKHTNFEDGTRSVFAFAPPLRDDADPSTAWQRGTSVWAPVELLDLMPTIIDVLGVDLSQAAVAQRTVPLQGTSLVPLMRAANPAAFVKAAAVSQYFRGYGSSRKWGYTLRFTRYRYTVWVVAKAQLALRSQRQIVALEGYDYLTDRYETVDVIVYHPSSGLSKAATSVVNWASPARFNALVGVAPFDLAFAANVSATWDRVWGGAMD